MQKIVGFVASGVTCVYTGVSMPVQITQAVASQNMDGFSLFMLCMLTATFSLWVVYGLCERPRMNWFIIVPNVMGAIGASTLLSLKIYFS